MRRRNTLITAAVVGAGALAAGKVVERRALRRLEGREDPFATEPFGTLRGTPVPVTASDGTPLHVEVDGGDRTDLAVVFSHGWTLTQDSWHFQRKALRGHGRLVFWDQRGHGRSGGGRPGLYSVEQLAHDLRSVIDATVPEGTPVVLVGHSMGGMTVLRLADEHPELFGDRIVAAGLVCTSSGRLGEVTLGMPAALAAMTQRVLPHGLRAAGLAAPLLERVRHLGRDGSRIIEDIIAFGPGASPAAVAFSEEMMADTRMDALLAFFRSMTGTPEISACTALAAVDTMIIGAENDNLTPLEHSLEIIAKCPTARLEVIPTAGHMAMLERPAVVSHHLADLVERARAATTRSLPA